MTSVLTLFRPALLRLRQLLKMDATLDILEVCLAKAKVPKTRKGFIRKNCPSSRIGGIEVR